MPFPYFTAVLLKNRHPQLGKKRMRMFDYIFKVCVATLTPYEYEKHFTGRRINI
jgi:hypothetical protein